MTKIIFNSEIHHALVRTGVRILKLGALAAVSYFATSTMRTAGNSFIQEAYHDYHEVRSIVQDAMA